MTELPDPEKNGAEYRKRATIFAVKMEQPFVVPTLEGVMSGKAGDWLAKGIHDELYPIDAKIFNESYTIVPVETDEGDPIPKPSWKCKEDGKVFDSEYLAFQHNLSHGRLSIRASELGDYFEITSGVKLTKETNDRLDVLMSRAARYFFKGQSPFDPENYGELGLGPTEAIGLSRAIGCALELSVRNASVFHDYLVEKWANQALGTGSKLADIDASDRDELAKVIVARLDYIKNGIIVGRKNGVDWQEVNKNIDSLKAPIEALGLKPPTKT